MECQASAVGPGEDPLCMLYEDEKDVAKRYEEQVLSIMREKRRTVSFITGPTGCGKSTRIPPMLSHFIGKDSKVLLTQPKIPQTEMIASYMSEKLKERIGTTIGLMHSQCTAISEKTRLIVSTVASAALKYNNFKGLVSDIPRVIIIDEIHEMNIQYIAMILLLYRMFNYFKDNDLMLHVVFSTATMGKGKYSIYKRLVNFFNSLSENDSEFTIIEPFTVKVQRSFDVSVHYCEPEELLPLYNLFEDQLRNALFFYRKYEQELNRDNNNISSSFSSIIGNQNEFENNRNNNETNLIIRIPNVKLDNKFVSIIMDIVTNKIWNIIINDPNSVILVFVPGISEILNIEAALQDKISLYNISPSKEHRITHKIHKIHSMFSPELLARAIEGPGPRVILSTDMSESSITIRDCDYVVDSGISRRLLSFNETLTCYYSHLPISSKLGTMFSTFDSLEQRAGRVGRTKAGHYYGIFPPHCYDYESDDKLFGNNNMIMNNKMDLIVNNENTTDVRNIKLAELAEAEGTVQRLSRSFHNKDVKLYDYNCLISLCRKKTLNASVKICDSAEFLALRFENALKKIEVKQLSILLGGPKLLKAFFINYFASIIRLCNKEVIELVGFTKDIKFGPSSEIKKKNTFQFMDVENSDELLEEEDVDQKPVVGLKEEEEDNNNNNNNNNNNPIEQPGDKNKKQKGPRGIILVKDLVNDEFISWIDVYEYVQLNSSRMLDRDTEMLYKQGYIELDNALKDEAYEEYRKILLTSSFDDVHKLVMRDPYSVVGLVNYKLMKIIRNCYAESSNKKEVAVKLESQVCGFIQKLFNYITIKESSITKPISSMPADPQCSSIIYNFAICSLPVFGSFSISTGEESLYCQESRKLQKYMLINLEEAKETMETCKKDVIKTKEVNVSKLDDIMIENNDMLIDCMIIFKYRKLFPRIKSEIYPYKSLLIGKDDNLYEYAQYYESENRYLSERGLSISAIGSREIYSLKLLKRLLTKMNLNIELNNTEEMLTNTPSVFEYGQPTLQKALEDAKVNKYKKENGIIGDSITFESLVLAGTVPKLTPEDLFEEKTIYTFLEKELKIIYALGSSPVRIFSGCSLLGSLIVFNTYEGSKIRKIFKDRTIRQIDQRELMNSKSMLMSKEKISDSFNGIPKENNNTINPLAPEFEKVEGLPHSLKYSLRISTDYQICMNDLIFALKEFMNVNAKNPNELNSNPELYKQEYVTKVYEKQSPPYNSILIDLIVMTNGYDYLNPRAEYGKNIASEIKKIEQPLITAGFFNKNGRRKNPCTFVVVPDSWAEISAAVREFRKGGYLNIGGIEIKIISCMLYKTNRVMPKNNIVKVPFSYKKILGIRLNDVKDTNALKFYTPKPCGRSYCYPIIKNGFIIPLQIQASLYGVKLYNCALLPQLKHYYPEINSIIPGGERKYLYGEWLNLMATYTMAKFDCLKMLSGSPHYTIGNRRTTIVDIAMSSTKFMEYYKRKMDDMSKIYIDGINMDQMNIYIRVLKTVIDITNYLFTPYENKYYMDHEDSLLDTSLIGKYTRLFPPLNLPSFE